MASGNTSSSAGNTSSSAEMLSSDSKEVVSSMRKEVDICEVSSTQVAELIIQLRYTREKVRQGDARAFSTGIIIRLAKNSAKDGFDF